MERFIILITIAISLFTISKIKAQTPAAKKVFKYSYDNAGNRIKRQYFYATPCNNSNPTLNDPNCNSRMKNDTILDSLFVIAQNIELKQPETPTEKLNYDGTPELKNIYPNPTKGLFVLEFTSLILNGSLQILDMKGNSLDEFMLEGIQWEIDLSLFPADEYILLIKTKDGKVYNKKIVKI